MFFKSQNIRYPDDTIHNVTKLADPTEMVEISLEAINLDNGHLEDGAKPENILLMGKVKAPAFLTSGFEVMLIPSSSGMAQRLYVLEKQHPKNYNTGCRLTLLSHGPKKAVTLADVMDHVIDPNRPIKRNGALYLQVCVWLELEKGNYSENKLYWGFQLKETDAGLLAFPMSRVPKGETTHSLDGEELQPFFTIIAMEPKRRKKSMA